jgi:hypothetical protein
MKAVQTEDLLQDSLQLLERGARLEDVLARHPERAAELRPLLEAALAARSVRKEIQVPHAAQMRSRALFLQAAVRPRKLSRRAIFRTGWSLASIFTVFALVLTGTGIASAQSLPGDQLYPVKIAAEHARLQLASDPAQRLQLSAGYDRERVDEVEALFSRSQFRPVAVSFAGFLSRPDPNGDWQVGAVHLLFPAALANLADLKPGRYVDVSGSPEPGGKVVVASIRTRIEELSGAIQSVQGGSLTVDQLKLELTESTHISGSPEVGDVVEIQAERQEDGSLQASVVDVAPASNQPARTSTATLIHTAAPDEPVQVSPAEHPTEADSGYAEPPASTLTAPTTGDQEHTQPEVQPQHPDPTQNHAETEQSGQSSHPQSSGDHESAPTQHTGGGD